MVRGQRSRVGRLVCSLARRPRSKPLCHDSACLGGLPFWRQSDGAGFSSVLARMPLRRWLPGISGSVSQLALHVVIEIGWAVRQTPGNSAPEFEELNIDDPDRLDSAAGAFHAASAGALATLDQCPELSSLP